MRRIDVQLFVLCGLCVSLGAPAIASAKEASTEEIVAAARASKLFKRELLRDQLQAAGLGELTMSAGVKMDFPRWVRETALDARPETAPLFDPKLPAGLLKGAPVYSEKIYELEDRLVVDRKLTVTLAPGACEQANKPQAVADLCFKKNPAGKPAKAVAAELASLRAKLAKAPADKIVRGTVTAAQALKLSDEQLLEQLLNSDARTVQQVSIVPRQPVKAGALGLHGFGAKLEALAVDTGLEVYEPGQPGQPGKPGKPGKPGLPGPRGDFDHGLGTSKTFPRAYFLTGFTYGREIEDSWEYTFAGETWLTDRYYVRVDYHLGLGFGVRAPFSVDVKASSAGADSRKVELSVAPVNVDTTGAPAYQAVGLPANKTFDGKEFVLEFKASCRLYVSIPGPNVDRRCPSIDLGYSRDIDPVIGGETSNIGDWWLNGSMTGLTASVAAASVSLDVGLGADVTNGRIGVRLAALPGSGFAGVNPGDLAFNQRSPLSFTVNRGSGGANAGFRLERPTYGFDIRVAPKLRARVKVDVSVYENTWILGPYALDFLAISRSFQLSHHAGTVAQHSYEVFKGGGLEGQVLEQSPSSPQPPPPPPGPKKWPLDPQSKPLLQK